MAEQREIEKTHDALRLRQSGFVVWTFMEQQVLDWDQLLKEVEDEGCSFYPLEHRCGFWELVGRRGIVEHFRDHWRDLVVSRTAVDFTLQDQDNPRGWRARVECCWGCGGGFVGK